MITSVVSYHKGYWRICIFAHCHIIFYCGCKSKHKNDTNKQFINKMRDKTTKILFYPAKRNKKILFILF
ncbi:hypothetical protein DXC10_08285 [Bacteroides sp. OM08-11]|nr:hypothetical protein DXC10_08285 [Bacteroides sp. OM08-11]